MIRHDRVILQATAQPHWFLPGATGTETENPPPETWQQAARHWLVQGRPLVMARQPEDAGETASAIYLGLKIYLGQQGHCLSCKVAAEAIASVLPPLSLNDCLHRLTAQDAAVLCTLQESILKCGARLGVYGSLAWECMARRALRHPASDVDLVCDVSDYEQMGVALTALRQASTQLSCRLDGEIRFGATQAVAWRELEQALQRPQQSRVLVKGNRELALVPTAQLFAGQSIEMPAEAQYA